MINTDKIEQVLTLIKEGMSLRKAVKIAQMSAETFYIWVDESDDNAKQYARACTDRAEAIMDEAYDIADDNTKDTITFYDSNGKMKEMEDKEYTNRSKLKVDLRRWHLSKLNPKKYGDKLDVTSDNEKIQSINLSEMVKGFMKGE